MIKIRIKNILILVAILVGLASLTLTFYKTVVLRDYKVFGTIDEKPN